MKRLLRAPLLFVTGALTLAIGVGLSTGVFAVVYGVLLRPLPYPDPDRLVIIERRWAINPGDDTGVPLAEVDEWRRRTRAFERIAGHSSADVALRGAGLPRSARAAMVTSDFFEVLGVAAAEGTTRGITQGSRAAALSHRLVRQVGDAAAWHTSGLTVGAGPFSPAAVMPADFRFPSHAIDVWVNASDANPVGFFSMSDQRRFRLVARLRPGITLHQASGDVARVARELNEGQPEGRHRTASVRPLDAHVRGDARASVLPFAAGAVLVLLIACANVSGLLVGRAAARRREFAVRRALGSGALALLRVSAGETLAIGLCGWVLGVGIAYLVVRAFLVLGDDAIPNLAGSRMDVLAVAMSMLLGVLVTVVTGVAPATRALRTDAGVVLNETSDRLTRGSGAARGALVVAQIAFTVILLVAAGLLMRTVLRILESERGFEVRHALAMRLMLTDTVRYNVADRGPWVDRLVSDARAIPGVAAAGVGSDLPPRGNQIQMTVRIVSDRGDETFALRFAAVTPGYLEAIGATLLKGRLLEDRDRTAAQPAVVITDAAARRMFPSEEPVGKDWPANIPGSGQVKPKVVGVVRDVKFGGLDRTADPGLFTTWERMAPSESYLVVRTHGDPRAVLADVRGLVPRLEAALPVYPVQLLEDVVAGSMADRRLRLQLAATFAALSLLMASVALWGAVAQNVLDRRRELAIRLALGSTAAGAIRFVVRSGLVLIGIGMLVGVLAAGWSARALDHLLHGVAPWDPLTFTIGPLLAGGVALLACYVPARRAASISPAELLREG